MSELTREQFKELVRSGTATWTDLEDHDAALRQEIERLRTEMTRIIADREHAWEDLAQTEQERDAIHARYERQCASVHRLMQENTGLRAALENLARRCAKISYPTDPSALDWNAAIDQAQQALGQKEGA